MISTSGIWYDGKTSAQEKVVCHIYNNGQVLIEGNQDHRIFLSIRQKDIKVSTRLANTPRYLYFPHGQKFETEDNEKIDQFIREFKRLTFLNIIHQMESQWRYVLTALVILLVFLWISVAYGIPFLSKTIAFKLPLSLLETASQQTLNALDRSFLNTSELSPNTTNRISECFEPIIEHHSDYDIRIYFRKGGRLGPNAFALPNGIIIFSDEIVKLTEKDEELLAILAHEIGHVVQRHGLRTLIQDSIFGFTLLAITGDVTGSSELFLGFPVLLTEMAYSRKFEWEADTYALEYLQNNHIPPRHFSNLMQRIEKEMKQKHLTTDNKWRSYLSTHPLTKERLQRFDKN